MAYVFQCANCDEITSVGKKCDCAKRFCMKCKDKCIWITADESGDECIICTNDVKKLKINDKQIINYLLQCINNRRKEKLTLEDIKSVIKQNIQHKQKLKKVVVKLS